ncbi:MAG TPA: ATP-binding protein, partial [Ktedonobacteraceae bacterium]|nr:ATP-binding protein [Ktedonobacteraceae bacterium]
MPEPLGRITTYSNIISARYPPDKFVGREWLIEEVTCFRDDGERRHLIIVGEPGSGKSAFLAYLAKIWNCPRHFIRVGSIDGVTGVDPRHFLIFLGAQLYQKYGRQIFEHVEDGNIRVTVGLAAGKKEIVGRFIDVLYTLPFLPLSEGDIQVNAGVAIGHSRIVGEHIEKMVNAAEMLDEKTLLHIALLNPLQKIQFLYPAEKVVILIDALDEAHYHSGVQIPDILPRATDADVPANLRLVMTSRPGEAANKFRPKDQLKLDDVDKGYKEQNLHDIGIYIKRQLVTTPFIEVIRSWSQLDKQTYQHEIEVKSDGNFLYLYHFFNELASAVEAGQTDLHGFRVPKGLDEIYRSFAVEKIRQNMPTVNMPTVIQFLIVGDVPDAVTVKLSSLPAVSSVQIQGKEVAVITTDKDATLPQLYMLGIPITHMRVPEVGIWEEKYLPILGVMAVAYEPLYREQIAGFARVEVIYVDSVLAQLK